MIEEFSIYPRHTFWVVPMDTPDATTEPVMKPPEPMTARILTGHDTQRYTGRREPVLVVGEYVLTRTTLLETLIKMGQLELKDPR